MRRIVSICLLGVFIVCSMIPLDAAVSRTNASFNAVSYRFDLPNGSHAVVYDSGLVEMLSKDYSTVEYRAYPKAQRYGDIGATNWFPDKERIAADLMAHPQMTLPFKSDRVVVVFKPGVAPVSDVQTVSLSALNRDRRAATVAGRAQNAPLYTGDRSMNLLLANLGVDKIDRLFRKVSAQRLSTMGQTVRVGGGRALPFGLAYRLHVTHASVRQATLQLLRSPDVLYASPDWYVATMQSPPVAINNHALLMTRPVDRSFIKSTKSAAGASVPSAIPSNYALASSAQSMLNAQSLDAAAAFDEIGKQFGQLPGQGEIVTNVSIGDIDDTSQTSNACTQRFVPFFGPTTELINGQHYINWPSMPLIPAYATDANGNLSGSAEVCQNDPFLGEVGLDFSVMAPLPHNLQRAGEQGSGLTDLLGIAPGASYRLVVPGVSNPTMSDIDAALLSAGLQNPRPDVITASLGFGLDSYGFPSRYLEDDPLSLSIITSLVRDYNIVVCIAANDGTRLFTNAAIGPSGGSAPTERIPQGASPTNLADIAFSTVPSEDYDSGAFDVGGVTLDDIFSVPPQYAKDPSLAAQHAFAATRWTGSTEFSTGFGSRIDVSAPSDGILALSHEGHADDSVSVNLEGGTSAASPEVAAVAAVALQVARLTGHPFANPLDLRRFLESTGSAVPNVSQADAPLSVGPQVNVRRVVEALLQRAGSELLPSVGRVAVEQRRNAGALDGLFLTNTDPTNIDLQGPISSADGTNTDRDEYAWITIAPDWEGMPAGTTYRLFADSSVAPMAARALSVRSLKGSASGNLSIESSSASVLARTPWARLLPGQILHAAGLPLISSVSRTVQLTYQAQTGARVLTSVTFALTFGPADTTTRAVLAPDVPATATGSIIPVTYDLSRARNVSNPTLVVSEPGRFDPATGLIFHPSYTVALTTAKGTVNVPVSALHGGGVYGIGIEFGALSRYGRTVPLYSDFAFTRVVPASYTPPARRAVAPTLWAGSASPAHFLEIPYDSAFSLHWDVSNVPAATGAVLEISDSAPNAIFNYNDFNNPNGSARDDNGTDSRSAYFAPLPGLSGSITLNGGTIGLTPTMTHSVRVLPVQGSVVVGEASDVSTITMDGVVPSDGGAVNYGFGIDTTGDDGFITSFREILFGVQTIGLPSNVRYYSTLESFDQNREAVTQSTPTAAGGIYQSVGAGMYGNDVGVFEFTPTESQPGVNQVTELLNPVSSLTISGAWTPPSWFSPLQAAPNPYSDDAAFLAFNTSTRQLGVTTSSLTSNTFGSFFNARVANTPMQYAFPFGFAENTKSQEAVIAANDFRFFCAPPIIAQLNVSTGALQSFNGIGQGSFTGGAAVDSNTNRAGVLTTCDSGFTVYNLNTGAGAEVVTPGTHGIQVAADEAHGLFLVDSVTTPDFLVNNNFKSALLVYNENGNLLATHEDLNLFGMSITTLQDDLQANWKRRIAYTFGPLAQQLEPLSY